MTAGAGESEKLQVAWCAAAKRGNSRVADHLGARGRRLSRTPPDAATGQLMTARRKGPLEFPLSSW
jgi:hypothetical protein